MKNLKYHGWILVEDAGPDFKDHISVEWHDKDGRHAFHGTTVDNSHGWRGNSGCARAIEWWDKKVGQAISLMPTPLGAFRVYTEVEELPVIKMSHAAMLLAYSDVRHSSMTLYVSINQSGDPLSCCGDLETLEIPVESEDPHYQPVAIIAVPSGIPVEPSPLEPKRTETHLDNLKHDITVACQTRLQLGELQHTLINTHKWPSKSVGLQLLRELLATLEGDGQMERSVKGYFQTINHPGRTK
jgi:hypothetical protein